jgi:twitching motility protein PilT
MQLENLVRAIDKIPEASHIHLLVGMPVCWRKGGVLYKEGNTLLAATDIRDLLFPHLPLQIREKFERGESNLLTNLRVLDKTLCLHLFWERGNPCAIIWRGLDAIPPLSKLGFSHKTLKILQDLTTSGHGLIVCSGRIGSGKTTLGASLLEEINTTRSVRMHIIDQIADYQFVNNMSLISQQIIGSDVMDYKAAMQALTYSDVDVLMLGEVPDYDTLFQAVMLSHTGKLVFLKTDASNTFSALQNLIHLTPDASAEEQNQLIQLLSTNLLAILHQQLLPRHNQLGRVPAVEILFATPKIREKLRAGQRDFTEDIAAGKPIGMQTMNQAIADLLSEGIISEEVAKQYKA